MKIAEDYKIVQASSKKMVQDEVNRLLGEGYQLHGETFPAQQTMSQAVAITQAMVKYRENVVEA